MSTKNARLDIRTTQNVKEMIERASNLTGRSITDFVIASAEEEARRTIRDHEAMELSKQDSKAFAEALINPPEPSRRLEEAANRYKESTVHS